ncbi:peroxisome bioproteinsis protein 7 [Hibiscus syriacus]|uniref:Peroxisome bioproteinsis protein 7 n=1 Tax=Hibiscus syriacus TaxID=106335 RepID=A0A6A2X4A5_HIBSY|nr:protein CHUP1, chloroplastic-like [Hibiscus syriacus]KAE8669913.1 peroxisome bioproteinsis protein 7 [Hibiscus syriacus]
MRDNNSLENRAKASSKFGDQNQAPKSLHTKTIANQSKPKSSWGSHIVKGFTGTADKKTKVQTITVQTKKPPLSNSDLPNTNQNNPVLHSHSRVKRSLITDLSCSVNATQVHPQLYQTHRRQSSGSRDLFIELDHVRTLLQESKEREFKLQAELTEWKTNAMVLDLEKQLETRNTEVDNLSTRVGLLESERSSLCDQLATLTSILERNEENLEISKKPQSNRDLEMEVVELRRLNKELQMQKRNIACKLSSLESQLASLAKSNESDVVAKAKAEASMLRHTNENLSKQVEGLQMSRLNEVEELAYLRWVNSCLRDELRNSCSTTNFDKPLSPVQCKVEYVSSPNSASSKSSEQSSASVKRLNFMKKMKKWSITSQQFSSSEYADNIGDKEWVHIEELRSPGRRHSISGSKCYIQELIPNKRRQSDGFMCTKEIDKEAEPLSSQKSTAAASSASLDFEKRALRIPNPPPRPSCSIPFGPKDESCTQIPPPPPPPPPKFSVRSSAGVVKRAPQVVEFYHSLMKRGSRKDSTNGGICDVPDVANVRSSMIGEIENRSSHLLAIKADVETQGEFVNSLIREVNNAVYRNIEDVVAFVKWLDDELCYLVDERAVLKHFAWPEKKADTLREAAFGYRDLKKLESEVLYYKDDSRVPCDIALKKMVALSEKMERTVYNLLRTRESLMRNCREFQIPTDWMLDNGIISKIKLGSVKLAKRYMKRVAMELQSKATLEKDPSMDYMLLQGVRFAFRIHQFAGGFDSETMHAFEELRNLANLLNKK